MESIHTSASSVLSITMERDCIQEFPENISGSARAEKEENMFHAEICPHLNKADVVEVNKPELCFQSAADISAENKDCTENAISSTEVIFDKKDRDCTEPEAHKCAENLHKEQEDSISNTFDFEVEVHTSNSSSTVTEDNICDSSDASAPKPIQELNFYCDKCKTTYKTALSFEVHQRWHSVKRPHRCFVCGVAFQHSTALEAHLQWHEASRPFVCVQCRLAFSQAWTLAQHKKKHLKCQYKCSTCGDKFAQRFDLKHHERRHTDYPYECDICGASYMLRYYLKIHMWKHTKRRPWKCRYCKAIFVERTSLDCHREDEHPRSFTY